MQVAVKEFTFDAAHVLTGHEGLCANLHGHTYKLQVGFMSLSFRNHLDSETVEATMVNHLIGKVEFEEKDMVMDFAEISRLVKEQIVSKMDHAFICDDEKTRPQEQETLESTLIRVLKRYNARVYVIKGRPTAENMAKHIFDKLQKLVPDSIAVQFVKLWETPTSYVEVQ